MVQNACDWEQKSMLSLEDTRYKLTCLFANAARHVRKYFLNRTEKAAQPNNAQQVGEFVTEIRRQLKYYFQDLAHLRVLTDTDAWDSVAVPSPVNTYKWRIPYFSSDGQQNMDFWTIQMIGENALKMADSEKTSEEEFREINSSLSSLLRETTALDTLVSKAKELNNQAEVVVGNLCAIAESLK